jgi:hypothetical protein
MMMMSLILTLGLLGQERPPARGPEIAKESAARLEFMKKSVAVHTLKPAGDPNVTYRLLAEPAIRFTNSVGTVTDGTIFFWLDADDHPVAAVQVYRVNSGSWRQAFSSLSTVPLTAGSVWNPRRSGVDFKPVPGAAVPAGTPEQRMRQMREILTGFKAELNFPPKTWNSLRPLTTPLLRYGKSASELVDGAVFAFVLTTDPEVYLLLEVRRGKNRLEWQYAFAPEANSPIRCTWKGKDAWSFDFEAAGNESSAPYYDWGFAQDP